MCQSFHVNNTTMNMLMDKSLLTCSDCGIVDVLYNISFTSTTNSTKLYFRDPVLCMER